MESFSLLKYWRTTTTTTTTTSTTNSDSPPVTTPLPETDDDSSSSDEGPFFDLEFAIDEEEENDLDHFEDGDEVNEFKFSLPTDDQTLSPSSDLFFKGRLLPLEPTYEPTTKHHVLPHLSLKSKLLVFALGLKKHHQQKLSSSSSDPNTSPATQGHRPPKHVGRFFAVKLEEVPIVSLFTRDNTNTSSKDRSHSQRPSVDDEDLSRRFSKETLHKYLNKIKPLYVKVSRRHTVKTTVAGARSDHHHSRSPNEVETHASVVPLAKKVVRKHLGKSRSASSVVGAATSPPPPPPPAVARRRDDSLLQQQDGIQSAIAHCKRSFNGSRETSDSSLPRSRSDSCDELACLGKCVEGCH